MNHCFHSPLLTKPISAAKEWGRSTRWLLFFFYPSTPSPFRPTQCRTHASFACREVVSVFYLLRTLFSHPGSSVTRWHWWEERPGLGNINATLIHAWKEKRILHHFMCATREMKNFFHQFLQPCGGAQPRGSALWKGKFNRKMHLNYIRAEKACGDGLAMICTMCAIRNGVVYHSVEGFFSRMLILRYPVICFRNALIRVKRFTKTCRYLYLILGCGVSYEEDHGDYAQQLT